MLYKVQLASEEEIERRKKNRELEEECCNKCKFYTGILLLAALCGYLICLIIAVLIITLETNNIID
tara:strand:+ start:1150 stop:1347 length:198 start_codon:yes stop_codon:yes gene_type:complete